MVMSKAITYDMAEIQIIDIKRVKYLREALKRQLGTVSHSRKVIGQRHINQTRLWLASLYQGQAMGSI